MINALWLILIVPVSASVGFFAAALCWAAKDDDNDNGGNG